MTSVISFFSVFRLSKIVIPGCAHRRRSGIHNHDWGVMDSGLAASRRPGMTMWRDAISFPQYDFGKPSAFSAMKLMISSRLTGAMRGISDSRK